MSWEEVSTTLTDLRYLAKKVLKSGVAALEADIVLASSLLPERGPGQERPMEPHQTLSFLPSLHRMIGRIHHLLLHTTTYAEIGGILLSHLGWDSMFATQLVSFEQALPRPFLMARRPLPDQATSLVRMLRGHAQPVNSCAISSDGRFIVSASYDKTLKVWDSVTGQERFTLHGHASSVNSCAISSEGRFIVSASDDKTLKVWNMVSGQERFSLRGHTDSVNGCAISSDGRFIVSASGNRDKMKHPSESIPIPTSSDNALRIWDVTTNQEHFSHQDNTSPVNSCEVSPDGRFIILPTLNGFAFWKVLSRRKHLSLRWNGDRKYRRVSFWDYGCAISPNGRFIVTNAEIYRLKIWDVMTEQERFSFSVHKGADKGCAISSDNRFIITLSSDSTLRVWDSSTGQEYFSLQKHTGSVNGCAISSTGHFLVTTSPDSTLRVWDSSTGQERFSLQGHTNSVHACAISPDGRFVASASEDKTLKVWNAQTGQEMLTFPVTGILSDCAFSPDGEHLVVSGNWGLYFLKLLV